MSFLPSRTGADSPVTGTKRYPDAAVHHVWHLHIGFVQLFIVGPGFDAWHACSKSYYTGQVGTDDERAIAHRAVHILARRHRDDKEAGSAEIHRALADAKAEILTGILTTIDPPEETLS